MKSSIKNLFTITALVTAGVFAQAQQNAPAALPTSLAATMKKMSSDLKKVATQVNDPSANAESEALANDYVVMVLHAKDFTPDSIQSLPSSQQKAAKADYDAMLDKSAENGKLLAQAFHNNENAKAVEALNLLSQDKKDGHAKYK